ncbi:hypothetical protein M885DRAFT_619116 [Pelagophyceae sp. CCMP2097]|nr:hypothetical protein M885DRAFT_619116 [Pelagophyceae sp. CCMP2097]
MRGVSAFMLLACACTAVADDMTGQYFGMIDSDTSGSITESELGAFVAQMVSMVGLSLDAEKAKLLEERVKAAFLKVDTDGSNGVDVSEAAAGQEHLTSVIGEFMALNLPSDEF